MDNQKKGSYKYSFLNPADEERVLMEWGGRTVVREKYPAVWAAIQRTKEYEYEIGKNQEHVQEVNGYVVTGCPNFTGDHEKEGGTGEKRLSALLSMRLEDGTYIPKQTVLDDEEVQSKTWPYAMLSGTIKNLTDSINVASYGREYYNINSVDVEMASDKIYAGTDFTKKKVETFCSYSGIDFNDVLHKENYHKVNPDYSDEEGSVLVRSFTVKAPYSQYQNNPIKMLYDREPYDSEKGIIDYSYKSVKDNSLVKTCMPIAAKLCFAENIVPATKDSKGNPMDILDKDSAFQPQLFFGNPMKARVKYNRGFETVKKCFIRNEYDLEIDFSKAEYASKDKWKDYWNEDMNINNYTTGKYEIGRTVELHADFYINLMHEKYKTCVTTGISIVSVPQDRLPAGFQYYQTNNGMTVYIPPINIRWGCFAMGTRITMVNGEKKPVELIRQDDVLFTTTGPAKVKAVYVGCEKELLCICTESGKSLKVTHTHPIILAGGKTVQARSVRPGKYLMTGNGEEDKVKWVFDMEYNSFVYNFEFTDGKEHVVEADGILAGEFISQNSCKNHTVHQQHITPQTQQLVEEFSALQMISNQAK